MALFSPTKLLLAWVLGLSYTHCLVLCLDFLLQFLYGVAGSCLIYMLGFSACLGFFSMDPPMRSAWVSGLPAWICWVSMGYFSYIYRFCLGGFTASLIVQPAGSFPGCHNVLLPAIYIYVTTLYTQEPYIWVSCLPACLDQFWVCYIVWIFCYRLYGSGYIGSVNYMDSCLPGSASAGFPACLHICCKHLLPVLYMGLGLGSLGSSAAIYIYNLLGFSSIYI